MSMVKFITKGYEPRKKTETQVENNSRQISVLSGQRRDGIKFGEFAGVSALFYILLSIWRIKRGTKRGEELLNAQGRDMSFLKLAMSKMSSIISAVIVNFAFFETKVKASMTRNKTYRAKVRLKKNTAVVDGACCNCKAGANGYCKHVRAVLYTILDFVESGFEEIPPNKSCTEKPQEWHKPRTQTPKNAPVRFSDIPRIHHDCDADKNNETDKRIQRKREKLAYTACPSYALKETSDQIYSFCCDLRANSDKLKPLVVDVLEGNDYKPVIVEDVENKFTKCFAAMDHDYMVASEKLASKFRQVHQRKWNILHLVRSENLT